MPQELLIDPRAVSQWEKSCYSYNNYLTYIAGKQRNTLSFIDLLYVSNFKGGNATINEPESLINTKLIAYSEIFKRIELTFENKSLADLTDNEVENLVSFLEEVCQLAKVNKETKIDGLGISYLSAMVHLHFPSLVPILDRRVLINGQIVTEKDIDTQEQIKNIMDFYRPLVFLFYQRCKSEEKNIREIDKDLFILKIPKRMKA